MDPALIGGLGIMVLFGLILLQVPIAFAMISVGVVGFALQGGGWLPALSFLATEPARAGRRKWTASTDAVTTGPLASVLAARPAATSIQDRTVPPKQMPSWSASAGRTSWWT